MADKRRFIDVWIIETNTVYKEVPYTDAKAGRDAGEIAGRPHAAINATTDDIESLGRGARPDPERRCGG